MFKKIFKKDELKLLWPFYLESLVFGLSAVIMPFFIIYFLDLTHAINQHSEPETN